MTEDKLRTELEPLVEATARAIYLARYQADGGQWEAVNPSNRNHVWLPMARAALEAAGVEGLLLKIESLRTAAEELRDDLLRCGEVEEDGITTVNVSHSRWMRFCKAIEQSQ